MPIADPFKAALAKRHRLYVKVCWKCGARNVPTEVQEQTRAKRLPVKLRS